MEADNIPHKPNMDDIGRKNVDQEGAGHEVKILDNAIQYVHPNGVMVMSERIAQPSNKKPFHFLRLPAEIRNMVYQCGTTYVPEADWLCPDDPELPYLWQPPITRANRQIRQECLHIFYEMFHFSLDLNVRSKKVAGRKRAILLPASQDQPSFQSFHETIQAFAPSAKNMLQISNLRFLSRLTINVILKGHGEDLGCVGFHMTSEDESNFASLAVQGLDWNRRHDVLSAWVDAAKGSETHWGGFDEHGDLESNRLGYFAHRAMVDEIVGLLCLIAEHCPQLTRSVSLIYDGQGLYGSDLYDLADDAFGTFTYCQQLSVH